MRRDEFESNRIMIEQMIKNINPYADEDLERLGWG